MNITGIIAEYNPFHKGHAYQIKTLKEQHKSDYIIVAMSGNFVQRGAPAICNGIASASIGASVRIGTTCRHLIRADLSRIH